MSEVKMSREFLTEAITNGTFDVDATEKALRKSLDNSFSYLYRLQRNLVQYEEFHFTTRNEVTTPDYGDLYLDQYERVCMNVNASLVPTQEKEMYKRSKYYQKEITIMEFQKERTLFHRKPVVIIDNQVLKNFSFTIHDGYFTIILPFDRNFLYEKKWDSTIQNLNETFGNYAYKNHTIDVQIIMNADVIDLKTNPSMLKKNSYDQNSYDRILYSYITSLVPNYSIREDGSYFAVLYDDKSELGSFLQDVEIDERGDFLINWDENAIQRLNEGGTITVRFIFYRYLKKYYGWKHMDVGVRQFPTEELSSEIALLYNGDKWYDMPIPTENLLVMKCTHNLLTDERTWGCFDNKDVIIKYPNLYHIEKGVSLIDIYHIYYFYFPGYDLHYEHQYWWFYKYLYLKFAKPEGITLEEAVNRLYFEEIDLYRAFDIELSDIDPTQTYEYQIYDMEIQDELIENRWHPYVGSDAIITTPENPIIPHLKNVQWPNTSLNLIGYNETVILRFKKVFDMIINANIVEYRYDEIDYLKNYQDTLTPLEYKVMKLKSFIKDDMRCFHDYLRVQDKTVIQYHLVIHQKEMEKRIRRVTDVHQEELSEPMYLFTFEKLHPRDDMSCRIFIDGFLCSDFVHETHGFSDFVYVPIRLLPDNSDVDIEIYPTFIKKYTCTFSSMDDVSYVEFPSDKDIAPTLSDLVLYNEESDYEVYPHSDFEFTILSDKYNYKTSDEEEMVYVLNEGYRYSESIWYNTYTNEYYVMYSDGKVKHFNPDGTSNGFIDRSELPAGLINIVHAGLKENRNKGYYNGSGEHFTSEGQPDPANNISVSMLNKLIVDGTVSSIKVLPTDNKCIVEEDKDYIGYRKVISGSSILNPDNKGVNVPKIAKLQIRLLNDELVGKPISIKVEKDSAYIYKCYKETEYPVINLNVINPYVGDEYIRMFRNGRLISKKRYALVTNLENPRIQVLDKITPGEKLFLDVLPYRNRLVRYISKLDSNIIDLRGYIDKPFDIKFYDVYLNGRRLCEKNIYPLSGWSIMLCGIHSIYNLEIYEKDRDWEYYACDFGDYYTFGDLIDEPFMEEDIRKELIDSMYPECPENDNEEDRQPYDSSVTMDAIILEMFYYDRLLPLGLATADSSGWDKEDIQKNFEVVYNNFHTVDPSGQDVLFLNPDDYIDSEEGDGKVWHAYMFGEVDGNEEVTLSFVTNEADDGMYIQPMRESTKDLPW